MRWRAPEREGGVVGSFAHVDALTSAVEAARAARAVEVLDVFSPVPVEEVNALQAPGRSPVRFVTFTGALAGLVGGFALAIGTALVWELIVGGKPVTHHVPFVVVGFELTILLGALFTLLALLLFARLPNRKFPGRAYRPEFSRDRFGLWLACEGEDQAPARRILEAAGADEVHPVGTGGAP